MTFRDLLADLDRFRAASDAERVDATKALVEALGNDWAIADGFPLALALVHSPSGTAFAAVPGGTFDMGMSDADRQAAEAKTNATGRQVLDELQPAAQPVHRVQVAPFLCACEFMDLDAFGADPDVDISVREEVVALVEALPFRLPSEAELEWLARNGTAEAFMLGVESPKHVPPSAFGIDELYVGSWAADDWHDDYVGAPATSAAWGDGNPDGVVRGGVLPAAIQSDEELPYVLASVRFHGAEPPDEVDIRLALDLPG